MGIAVVLQDENGTKIARLDDPTNILHRVLPAYEDPSFRFLNYVDWYGDTVFNRGQLPGVRQELERLINSRSELEEVELLRGIDELAERAMAEPHFYLKFYGD